MVWLWDFKHSSIIEGKNILEKNLSPFYFSTSLLKMIILHVHTAVFKMGNLNWITNKDLQYNTLSSLSVTWQPGWEGSLRLDTCVCMTVPSLFTWNDQNIVIHLYLNTKLKVQKHFFLKDHPSEKLPTQWKISYYLYSTYKLCIFGYCFSLLQ